MKHKTGNQGLISELEFAKICQQRGLLCSKPLLDIGYDYIVDNGSKLFKVQIKSRTCLDRDHSASVAVTKSRYCRSPYYTNNEVDIFAVHLPIQDIWFLFPFSKIAGKQRIRLTFKHERKTSISNYKYLNNWEIFQ